MKKSLTISTLLVFLVYLDVAVGVAAPPLIGKCAFGALNSIQPGEPYLYIFGRRIKKGSNRTVEQLAVQHEIAVVEDDIKSLALPNFKDGFLRPAELRKNNTTIYWEHDLIGGETSSMIQNIFDYSIKDHLLSQTNGIQSALAVLYDFGGAYPLCWILGMSMR